MLRDGSESCESSDEEESDEEESDENLPPEVLRLLEVVPEADASRTNAPTRRRRK